MELKIDSAMGSMNEEIDIEKDGKDIVIGFNPKFLIDALKVIDDEDNSYVSDESRKHHVLSEMMKKTYTYLILPVNISQNQNR